MCVEERLTGHELQQLQTPVLPLLNDLGLPPVEELRLQRGGEPASKEKLLVDKRQLLVQILKIGEPGRKK